MINLLRAERFKLQRNKSFWMILILVTAVSLLFHGLIMSDWWMMSGTAFDEAGLGELNGLALFITPLFFNLAVGSLAGFFISSEFSPSGVIRLQVMSGYKRAMIYLAKYMLFSLGAIIITIVIPLIASGVVAIFIGQGDLLNAQTIQYLIGAYSLFTLQFLGYTAIVMILAILTEDSGKTIIISILFTIVIYIIEQFSYQPVSGFIYELTIFHQLSYAFTPELTPFEVIKSLAIGVISIMIFLAIGIALFNRKEIK